MIIIARSVGLLILGLVIGAGGSAAWLGRYEVTVSSTTPTGFSHAVRLDRWTGAVKAYVLSVRQDWRGQEQTFE